MKTFQVILLNVSEAIVVLAGLGAIALAAWTLL